MSNQAVAEAIIRPFGEGGAELGMTRAEMLEHLDALSAANMAALGNFAMSLVFRVVVAASIWWAMSCRKNKPNEIGSPL